MKTKKFILSGGGTGGHIYPALSIANELKTQFPDCEILFVGAKDKMEMQKVPQAGYQIKGLWIAGIQRKITLQNLMFPLKLISSLYNSIKIIKQFKPDVVIGTGGFASGPLLQMANLLNIPTVVQEQNSYPGITNQLLAKKAAKICVAYQGLERFFETKKLVITGNPVRQDLIDIKEDRENACKRLQINPSLKTILILGGSLGARRINQLIEKELDFFKKLNIQLLWQCGKLYENDYLKYNSEHIKVVTFIEKMDDAYQVADFIISRSGASSVSELCLVAKPVIFIPSPNVAEDHQTKNAEAIVKENGALLIKEKNLDFEFENEFLKLFKDEEYQKDLSKNIKKLAKPNATKAIVAEIIKLLP
jgi:UDP-N-acetylglucosamine--N-acetylmuramyl-(pentapeptide) pyrophosphoryl-undecaprenol N-acetylglucosamine transferase